MIYHSLCYNISLKLYEIENSIIFDNIGITFIFPSHVYFFLHSVYSNRKDSCDERNEDAKSTATEELIPHESTKDGDSWIQLIIHSKGDNESRPYIDFSSFDAS